MKKEKIIILLNIIGANFYILGLSNIEGLEMKCFSFKGNDCLYVLAEFSFFSGIIAGISLFIICKYNFKINKFLIIFIYLFLYSIDHHKEIVKHGFYNFILFIITIILIIISLYFIRFFLLLLKKRKIFFFVLIIIVIYNFYFQIKKYKLNHFSCDNWAKGLNNTYIDNFSKDYPCLINIPKQNSCFISEIGPFFDFSAKYRPTCLDEQIMKKERILFLKDLQEINFFNISNKKHFGFPLTNSQRFKPDDYGNAFYTGNYSFENDLYKNIILMDLYYQDKERYYPNISKPEIEILFKGNAGKVIINIEKNETLIKERKKMINKSKNANIYKNILVMFFDTLSRAHFFRKFPKTVKFFENFSRYEKNLEKKNISIFQYLKYNSINTFTAPNLIASYYGGKLNGNGTHFGNLFKNNGFIIGRTNNFCEKEIVINEGKNQSFNHCIWDHENLSIGCIKSLYNGHFLDRISSMIKKCLFGKDLSEYSLEYLKTFWNVYKNQNKMFLYQSIEGHEPTGELIGHYDELYYQFLKDFYSKGFLKDTAIILFSDHGQHLNGPFYIFKSRDFLFERTLATLFLLIPNNEFLYKDNLYEILKYNQQIFVTPFDIYNTLVYLSSGKDRDKYYVSFGNSLFTKLNIQERYCQSPKYENQINWHTCNCIKK